ncbi:MAG: hypothetical protein ACODAB_01135, partial [Gemmatimonadota bacterium]
MGIEALITTLEREAEERCAAVREEARAEAERIRREADERGERRRAAIALTLEAELRAREEAALAATRTKTRAALLRARRGLLDKVFHRAAELQLEVLEEPIFLESLPAALRGALRCVSAEPVDVVCPPALGDHLRSAADAAEVDDTGTARTISVSEEDDAPV